METPDVNNKRVLTNGSDVGSNVIIPIGGQTPPTKTAGDNDDEKKAQKKPKKSIISEIIKQIIPVKKSRRTKIVFKLRYSPSIERLFIQKKIDVPRLAIDIIKRIIVLNVIPVKDKTNDITVRKTDIIVIKGMYERSVIRIV